MKSKKKREEQKGTYIDTEIGNDVAHKTVVGGRAIRKGGATVSIPAGIERILYLASAMPQFRERLLKNPEEVINDPHMGLTEDEREVLKNIDKEQLECMIANIDLNVHSKRAFLKKVMASCAIALATSLIQIDCGESTGGIRPEDAVELKDANIEDSIHHDTGGNRPDLPDIIEDLKDANIEDSIHYDTGGSRPDVPDVEIMDVEDESDE